MHGPFVEVGDVSFPGKNKRLTKGAGEIGREIVVVAPEAVAIDSAESIRVLSAAKLARGVAYGDEAVGGDATCLEFQRITVLAPHGLHRLAPELED